MSHSEAIEKDRSHLEQEIANYLQHISLYSHLVNSAKDTILITDTDGKILNSNPALNKSFRIETDHVIGVELGILFGMPDSAGISWESVSLQATQGGWNGEVVLYHPNIGQIPADCSISAVHDSEGDLLAYSVILRDIRDKKILEEQTRLQKEELEAAYRKLRELDLAKSNFLNLISHELRTPITSILAYSELLKTEGMVEPDEQQQFFDIIHTEGEKLRDMVSKVLAISKMESGQMLFNFSESQVEEMVRAQVAWFRPQAESKGLEMDFEAESDLKAIVFDEENLREAIGQLLDNSIKFSDSGKITVRVGQHGNESLISIADTGKGIEGKDYGNLLEKFSRGDQVNISHHGLGLGLPLSYLIVKAHSVSLSLESNSKQGTTVSIVLPNRPGLESDQTS